tara:strand:- start:47 stop:388 length:342 start_codon:yes stop_codon:yes gene_type:complete
MPKYRLTLKNKLSRRKQMMNGTYLKKLRTEAGLSQRQMAEKLGYMAKGKPNRSHIARIENGHQKITERLVLAVKYVCEKTELGRTIVYGEPEPTWQETMAASDENTVTISAID